MFPNLCVFFFLFWSVAYLGLWNRAFSLLQVSFLFIWALGILFVRMFLEHVNAFSYVCFDVPEEIKAI